MNCRFIQRVSVAAREPSHAAVHDPAREPDHNPRRSPPPARASFGNATFVAIDRATAGTLHVAICLRPKTVRTRIVTANAALRVACWIRRTSRASTPSPRMARSKARLIIVIVTM